MFYVLNHPRILALICVFTMWLASRGGAWVRSRLKSPEPQEQENLILVVSATLTLLGLIIGFTFSLATSRYDQRRLFEEQEANAIGTEYVRAELLPANETAGVKQLLAQYLDHRIDFYQASYGPALTSLNQETASLQTQLWQSIKPQAAAHPDPVTALVVSGMNDVLNSEGYTQFAWWNRIPTSAWGLMIAIALLANMLVGYAAQRSRRGTILLFVLPVIVSISFFLIADIDSPRGGLIRIQPVDLQSLAHTLK